MSIEALLKEWHLLFVSHHEDKGVSLPREEPLFQETLVRLLAEQQCKVKIDHLLARLSILPRMTTEQRSHIKHAAGGGPCSGWRIMHCGRYRIFLDIDEQQHTLSFMVRHRINAYT